MISRLQKNIIRNDNFHIVFYTKFLFYECISYTVIKQPPPAQDEVFGG